MRDSDIDIDALTLAQILLLDPTLLPPTDHGEAPRATWTIVMHIVGELRREGQGHLHAVLSRMIGTSVDDLRQIPGLYGPALNDFHRGWALGVVHRIAAQALADYDRITARALPGAPPA